MVDEVQGNINVNIDTSAAIASLKRLQGQISQFHTSMAKGGASANREAALLQQNLINSINKTGQFSASMTKVASSTEAFTTALESNKLSMGQHFRYAMASTKTFGKGFANEFNTIQKVAESRVRTLQTQFIGLGRDANGALSAIKVRPLTLDMNDLSTRTQIAAQKAQIFNKLVNQGATNLLNWGKNTQWAGRQLMVGFTIPLTIFASTASKAFMEMEKQVIAFKRVYGDFSTTKKQTDDMAESVKALANEFTQYGIAVKDTMSLAAKAAAMGKTGADLTAQIRETSRLAVLGQVDQQQALDTTISLTNAFGLAADELAGKIDFLNAVENQTVTSIEDLTIAIPKAGPVVKQLGGNVEDLSFLLTAMREGGINASEGANALKSGIAALINPTKAASDMLAGYGINVTNIVNSNKGDVKGLITEFATALDDLDPLSRAKAIEQMFGKFQFSRISTLFQNVIKEGSQASQVLKLANSSSQELAILSQRELSKVSESTTYKFEKAITDFQTALAPVGEQFLKLVTPIIEFGTKMLEKFNGLDDGVKGFITTIVAGVGVVGPVLLMTIGLFANAVANIISVVQFLRSTFSGAASGSKNVATQTEYMTQAQLVAEAAAAGLNQTHSRLIQTYNVEAGALANLTRAYETTARAAGLPIGRGGAAMPRGKKYASGVVSVPGPKGAGDVVPAMLSPGEAVIPADMAKKYGGLINGMISNSIPGYARGTGKVGLSDQIRNQGLQKAPPLVAAQTRKMVWDTLDAELKAMDKAARAADPNVTEKQMQSLRLKNASHIKPDTEAVNFNGQTGNIKNWRAANIMPDLGAVNNYLQTVQSSPKIMTGFLDNVDKVAKELGMTVKEVKAEAVKIAKGEHPTTRSAAKVLSAIAKSDTSSSKYRTAAVSGVLNTRLRGNYYETLGQRKYDPSLDEKAAKTRTSKIENLRKKVEAETGVKSKNTQTLTPAEKRKATIAAKKEAAARAAAESQAKRDATNARARERYAANKAALAPAPKKPSIGSRIASGVKSMGGMGIGMGVSLAGGAVSMIPGMQEIGMGMSMLGPLFMMFPPQVAGVIAAVALLGFGVYKLIEAQEEQRKKAIELANASTMSQAALEQMSEDFGTVSVTQARKSEQDARLTKVTEEQMTAGQQYITEMESGKKLLAGVKAQQAAGVSTSEIGQNVASNLATAVAQQVISKEQGNAIIAALGAATGNFGISGSAGSQFQSYTRDLTQTANAVSQATLNSIRGQTKNSTSMATTSSSGVLSYDAAPTLLDPNGARQLSTKSVNAYSQAVGGIDSINAVYDAKVKEAKTQDQINKLEDQRASALKIQKQLATDIYAEVKKQKDIITDTEFSANFLTSIKETFGVESDAYKTAENINQLGSEDKDFKLRLQTQLQSGTLSSQSIETLLQYGKENKTFGAAYDLAITKHGEADTLDLISYAQYASATPQTIDLLINAYSTMDPETAKLVSLGVQGVASVGVNINGIDEAKLKELGSLVKEIGDKKEVSLNFIRTKAGTQIYNDWKTVLKNRKMTASLLIKVSAIGDIGILKEYLRAKGIVTSAGGLSTTADALTKGGLLPNPNAVRRWAIQQDRMNNPGGGITPPTTPGPGGGGGSATSTTDPLMARLQARLAKQNALLAVISLKEEKINKLYDERKKALEEISEINSNIAEQQKDQLDLADALARGDVAAAAKAVQTQRATAAAYAQEQQMKALEEQRQNALDLVTFKGKTRKDVEAKIDKLNMKIAKREYRTLGRASGGMITGPGTGTSDSIPARLSNGEYVINAKSVQKIGIPFLNAINAQGFANGGMVNLAHLTKDGKSFDINAKAFSMGGFVTPTTNKYSLGGIAKMSNGDPSAVYNYSVTVNAATSSNADDIAQVVMQKIKQVEGTRLRGNRY